MTGNEISASKIYRRAYKKFFRFQAYIETLNDVGKVSQGIRLSFHYENEGHSLSYQEEY